MIRPACGLVIARRFLAISQTNFSRLVTIVLYTNNSTWPPQMLSIMKTLISLTTGVNSRYLLLSCQAQYYSLSACSAIKQTANQAIYRTIRLTSNGLNLKSISFIATQNACRVQTKLYINQLNLFTYIVLLIVRKAIGWS